MPRNPLPGHVDGALIRRFQRFLTRCRAPSDPAAVQLALEHILAEPCTSESWKTNPPRKN